MFLKHLLNHNHDTIVKVNKTYPDFLLFVLHLNKSIGMFW